MYIRFQCESNLSFAWGNKWSFFAYFLANSGLVNWFFLEGSSGQLVVFDDLRSYGISRGDSGREDFDTREEISNLPKNNFKWPEFR